MKVVVFHFKFFGVNTYLLFDPISKEAAVIDPGMSDIEEEKALDNYILKNDLKLKYIINTHFHIDHVVGNHLIKDKYNVPVLASPLENELGKNIKSQAQLFGLTESFNNVSIDRSLKPGDTLFLGKEKIEVLDVSGHSPGGLAFYVRNDNFVIVGDALFKMSIGRTDLPGSNHNLLIKNIKENLMQLPEETLVLPGHGEPTTIGEEKRLNPFF